MRTSAASARLSPAPTAAPLTAAIVGSVQLRDGEEAVVDRPQAVLGRLAERGQVGARAERLARPGDDEGVHVGVRLGRVDGRAQRRPRSRR